MAQLRLSKTNKYTVSSMLLFVLFMFPIMPNAVQSLSIFAFIGVSVLLYYKNFLERIKRKEIWKSYLMLTGFFWFSFLSVLWSKNIPFFFVEIRPTLTIAFLPFVVLFFHPKIKEKTKTTTIIFFLVALIIYTALWFFHHIEGISLYQEILAKEAAIRDENLFQQVKFLISKPYKLYVSGLSERGYELLGGSSFFSHYSYISSYYLLGSILASKLLREKHKIGIRLLALVALVLSVFLVFYMQSKINILLLIILATTYLLSLPKLRWIVVFVFLAVVSFNFSKTMRGINELLTWELSAKENKSIDVKSLLDYKRSKIYACALPKIKENILFGVGQGDAQGYLDECLQPYQLDLNRDNLPIEYNTHSQYLYYFLVGGVFSGLLFLTMLIYLLYMAYKQKNYILACFILIVAANCLFENYLSRVYGVLFFVLFLSVLPKFNTLKSQKSLV